MYLRLPFNNVGTFNIRNPEMQIYHTGVNDSENELGIIIPKILNSKNKTGFVIPINDTVFFVVFGIKNPISFSENGPSEL